MATKYDIQDWIIDALNKNSKSASIVEVAKHIWLHHESDLRVSGDLFYTWQYEMRWAATQLRANGRMKDVKCSIRGVWELAG